MNKPIVRYTLPKNCQLLFNQIFYYGTPVPGGVGPITVVMLLENVVSSANRFDGQLAHRKVTPLPLKVERPGPSDILVSGAQTSKNEGRIA